MRTHRKEDSCRPKKEASGGSEPADASIWTWSCEKSISAVSAIHSVVFYYDSPSKPNTSGNLSVPLLTLWKNYVLQVIILVGFSDSEFRWFSLTVVLGLDNVCLSYQLKALKVIWELQGTFCVKSLFLKLTLFHAFC